MSFHDVVRRATDAANSTTTSAPTAATILNSATPTAAGPQVAAHEKKSTVAPSAARLSKEALYGQFHKGVAQGGTAKANASVTHDSDKNTRQVVSATTGSGRVVVCSVHGCRRAFIGSEFPLVA